MKFDHIALFTVLLCSKARFSAADESPELLPLPTVDDATPQQDNSESDTQSSSLLAAILPKDNALSDKANRAGRCKALKFPDFLRSTKAERDLARRRSAQIAKARARHGYPLWIRYLAPIVEYFYYGGNSRPVAFADSEDGKSTSLRGGEDLEELEAKATARLSRKVNCTTIAEHNSSNPNSVILVNDTTLQRLLRNEKVTNETSPRSESAVCQMLLLFAPWCAFSAKISAHYNAMSRLFPDLEVLAINAVTLNYWNARFGTVAVPNVLLFHNGKFVAKYNYTEKNIETLAWFVQNMTNLNASEEATLLERDYTGVVPTKQVAQTDYYLLLSWSVIFYALGYGCHKYRVPIVGLYHYLTNMFNYDQNHLD